jgi:hypothetical protein
MEGPCHHGMAYPRVADGRDDPPNLEARSGYIESRVAYRRQWVVLNLGG